MGHTGVIIAEEVGIIRNGMDDQRRVVRLGPWQRATLHLHVSHTVEDFAQLEVWWIVCR